MPEYYTYKKAAQAAAKPGQTVGFTTGKGYYVTGTATPRPATSVPAQISEHGQGGGSRPGDAGAKVSPKLAQTGYVAVQPKPASPTHFSEHGQGGGSSSGETGPKPTPTQTRTGYASPQPKPATGGLFSEHGRGGGSAAGETGAKRTTTQTHTGYLSPPTTTAAVVLIPEHGQGGGSKAREKRAKPTKTETQTGYRSPIQTRTSQARQLAGLSDPGGVLHDLSKIASDLSPLTKASANATAKLLHLSSAALKASEQLTAGAGGFLETLSSEAYQRELKNLKLEATFGENIARLVQDHAATVAWIASIATIATPPPIDGAFALIAAVATVYSGQDAFRQGKYVEAGLDFSAVLTGGGALTAERLARSADESRTVAIKAFEKVMADPEDTQALTEQKEARFTELVKKMDSSGKRRAAFQKAKDRRDVETLALSVIADPTVTRGRLPAGHR